MSVATSLPFSPMPSSVSPTEAGLQPFALGGTAPQDPSSSGAPSFGSLLDSGMPASASTTPSMPAELQASPVIPSGLPLTAGCLAQVAASQPPLAIQTATLPAAAEQSAVTPAAQQALPQVEDVSVQQQPPAVPGQAPQAPSSSGKSGSKAPGLQVAASRLAAKLGQPELADNFVTGQGGVSSLARTLGDSRQASDSAEEETAGDPMDADSQASDSGTPALPMAVAMELVQLPAPVAVAPELTQPSPQAGGEQSSASAVATDASASSAASLPDWTPLRQSAGQSWPFVPETIAPDPQDGSLRPELPAQAQVVSLQSSASQTEQGQASTLGLEALRVYPQPTIRSAKALAAYDSGLQPATAQALPARGQVSGAQAVQASPAADAATQAVIATRQDAGMGTTATQAIPSPTTGVAAAPVVAETVSQTAAKTLSLESSTEVTAYAKDGNAKEGAAAGFRAEDSTKLSPQANSAASVTVPRQEDLGAAQKKSQSTDAQPDVQSVKSAGTRNAKSDASMSINRRTRTEDARSEETLATAASAVPATRSEAAPAAPKTGPADSAQRAVATVTELVDRLQARPATKVAIDVPLSGEQNVSVKLEYKAGVLHVNFRTDSAEMRDALSREWSTVAAQSDSALRYAEPSFNSNSQDQHQQSKADAFDMGWNRQGQQQQRPQQQDEAPRAFSLPGARGGSSTSATDGVTNRDRSSAARQPAPDTSRHLNVVA